MIETVPETSSTNADLAARLRAGAALDEGHWLVADRQTGGRGRQGRQWQDGAGNFMGSTVVRMRASDPPPQTLTFAAGLAVLEALRPYAPNVRLKWPNDVLLDGAKLAGTLLEADGDAVVVGIGVNLRSAPNIPERRAACLPQMLDRDEFAADLAACFAEALDAWRKLGIAPLLERWSAVAHPIGEALTVHEPDGTTLSGSFAGLTPEGALRLRLADGSARVIHAGDVTLSPMRT